MAELLLNVAVEDRVCKSLESIELESVKSKYDDILKLMYEVYRLFQKRQRKF